VLYALLVRFVPTAIYLYELSAIAEASECYVVSDDSAYTCACVTFAINWE
jgi:hypothetical protein